MTLGVDIPTSWSWSVLGDVVNAIEAGASFKCDERPPEVHETGVAKVSAVTWGTYDENESKTVRSAERIDERLLIEPGDFLFSRANTINLVGACVIAGATHRRVMLSDKILRFRIAEVLPQWVLYYLRSRYGRSEIERLATGNQESMRNIGQDRIRAIRLPVAPLAEQRRIVAALEEHLSDLDAAVAGLKRARANIDNYRRAVLDAAVRGVLLSQSAIHSGESASKLLGRILAQRVGGTRTSMAPLPPGASVPEGWAVASLEQLTDGERVICYGILMPKGHVENGVRYVKVRDMRGDRIDVASLQRTSPEIEAQYARARLRPHDLLLSIRGTYGRVAEVPPELDGGNITQDTARLAVTPLVDRGYMALYLRAPLAQAYFKAVARGVAVKGVNIADVRAMPVLLPPRSEQESIRLDVERRLVVADRTAVEIDVQLARAKRLRQAILSRAFEGRLVPQDPSDEPASALLDRIRADRTIAPAPRRAAGRRAAASR